jgi:hypothetical protein
MRLAIFRPLHVQRNAKKNPFRSNIDWCHIASLFGQHCYSWDTTGILFAQAITALNAALTAAIAAGHTPIFRGVLWCQGEQDAIAINGGMITQGQYITALTAMIARFRAATIGGTTYSAMPFYLFRTGTDPSQSDAGFASVRAAQDSTIAADLHSQVVFRDAINFPALGFQRAIPNSIHYTQAGYNVMGKVGAANVLGGIAAPIAARRQSNSNATPTATSSTSAVMMGLGFSVTPNTSGNLLVLASLSHGQSVALDGAAFQITFGTGTAPANGAALAGTAVGGAMPSVAPAAAAKAVPVSLFGLASGLTPGTAYWFDLSYKALTGGTVTPVNVEFTFIEI